MPPRPKFHTLDDVARWVEDHESEHVRARNEIRTETKEVVDGAKAHIDRVTAMQNAQLSGIEKKIDTLGGLSAATVDELRLAREERIRRAAADEEKARIKKELSDRAEEAAAELERKRKDRRQLLTILIPVILALLTLLGAAIGSHH